MTSVEFAYWLQGFFEISGTNLKVLDTDQIAIIKAHLNMVFIHEIDPKYPVEQHEALQTAHSVPSYLTKTDYKEGEPRPRC